MTRPSPPQTSKRVPTPWRWRRVVLLVLLAGIGTLCWRDFTYRRAVRQLREVGFEVASAPWLGARVWWWARKDWRLIFYSEIWKSPPDEWKLGGAKARELRNLGAVAPALRRVNPEQMIIYECTALENLDGLKGLTGLQRLDLSDCPALQNLDGLKGLPGLQRLDLSHCHALQNVDVLKGLTGLQTLYLVSCAALQNVDGLKGLTSLQKLYVSSAALHNVDVLKGLTGLQELNLIGCRALQNVDDLKGLTGLHTLDLRGCSKISAPALRDLRAALPATDITFPDRSKSPPQ